MTRGRLQITRAASLKDSRLTRRVYTIYLAPISFCRGFKHSVKISAELFSGAKMCSFIASHFRLSQPLPSRTTWLSSAGRRKRWTCIHAASYPHTRSPVLTSGVPSKRTNSSNASLQRASSYPFPREDESRSFRAFYTHESARAAKARPKATSSR